MQTNIQHLERLHILWPPPHQSFEKTAISTQNQGRKSGWNVWPKQLELEAGPMDSKPDGAKGTDAGDRFATVPRVKRWFLQMQIPSAFSLVEVRTLMLPILTLETNKLSGLQLMFLLYIMNIIGVTFRFWKSVLRTCLGIPRPALNSTLPAAVFL